MRPTMSMEEIAKIFGVSKVTVSKALNDKAGVSDELRQKIKAKANELGYRINPSARGLKTNKNYNVGIIIPSRFVGSDSSYYFGVYIKVVTKLTSLGYSSILEVIQPQKEKDLELPDIYVDNKVDGLIVMGQLSDNYLALFEESDIPVIFFDFYLNNTHVDCVVTDNFYSGWNLTELLIAKGHRKIGFVGNVYSTSSIQDRFLGYCRGLLAHKITLDKDIIISDRDDDGQFIKLKLPKNMPTAFVCNNDQVAYDLIKLLQENGYRVPDDISVASFDNTKFSIRSNPQITTVDNNVDEMVDVACKVIIKKIEKTVKQYNRILIKTTLIERDSIKDINERKQNND